MRGIATITTLPDDYLLSALQIASSLADQICTAEEDSDCESLTPSPGAVDWIDSIVVITEEDRASSPSSDAHGRAGNNIRAEILPFLLSNTSDDKGARHNGTLYSLGVVFYELFSMGERPAAAEIEPKQIVRDRSKADADVSQIQTGTTNELLKRLDLDPGTIDVDIDGGDLFGIDDLHGDDPLAIDDLHSDDKVWNSFSAWMIFKMNATICGEMKMRH